MEAYNLQPLLPHQRSVEKDLISFSAPGHSWCHSLQLMEAVAATRQEEFRENQQKKLGLTKESMEISWEFMGFHGNSWDLMGIHGI